MKKIVCVWVCVRVKDQKLKKHHLIKPIQNVHGACPVISFGQPIGSEAHKTEQPEARMQGSQN